ncbi:uncharacterized protein Dere_GG26291 [Drosophila erecta]|uniref:Uncharacterized protein n=1 Tax=Drosophila erecta TaxID=7220 RepID=A0A0Q5U465_DROER|nr:uncharacterized protein Dere_GG26291 [Drosophila erecta]
MVHLLFKQPRTNNRNTSSSKKKKTIVHYKRKIHRPAKRRTIRHSRKGKGRKKSSNKTESRRN